MKKVLALSLAALILIFNSGCKKDVTPYVEPINLDALYHASIIDAMTADSSEICDTLWPISSTNTRLVWKVFNDEQYVLMGSFNKYPNSYKDSSVTNSWGVIWVFIPEQYKSKMKTTYFPYTDTLLRTRQLIGLPPSNTSTYIVELWVKPKDLYRPAADPKIDTRTAGLYFPPNSDANYIKWFNQNIYDSYYSTSIPLPWTRLGYSYDWAKGASEVGIEEYCIKVSSLLFVNRLATVSKYLVE